MSAIWEEVVLVRPEVEVGIPPEIDTLMLIKSLNQVWSQFRGVKHKLHLCLCLQISPNKFKMGKTPPYLLSSLIRRQRELSASNQSCVWIFLGHSCAL